MDNIQVSGLKPKTSVIERLLDDFRRRSHSLFKLVNRLSNEIHGC